MAQTITIDPVTRVEGHAKITLHLNDAGAVEGAQFHVTQLRGFEKFCEGRPYQEMPAITSRTCGICPVSHLVCSSKACDALQAVQIPPTAANLRRIMNLAQLIQSHALSFFHLSSPDLLLGWDADPKQRNFFGVAAQFPEFARDGIRLRKLGQSIIELLGGKRLHAAWTVAGGVSDPLTVEHRDAMLTMIAEALDIACRTLKAFKPTLEKHRDEILAFGNFPTYFLGIVDPTGGLEHYDGCFRVTDADGNIVEDQVPASDYERLIGEAVEPYSFMKFPYLKSVGYPTGIYRVGPLARLNVVNHCGTPLADAEFEEFRGRHAGPELSTFQYHHARLIEIIHAAERIQALLRLPDITDPHVRAIARHNRSEGIGVSEAPRGTLIHHYKIDDHGLMKWCNLIIATGHNNLAMNQGILQTAKKYVDGKRIQEGMLNRVEAVLRCFDPCLSCATHAFGQMPLRIQLLDAQGQVVDERHRSSQ